MRCGQREIGPRTGALPGDGDDDDGDDTHPGSRRHSLTTSLCSVQIIDMSTSKTGKHGHAKVHLVATDVRPRPCLSFFYSEQPC